MLKAFGHEDAVNRVVERCLRSALVATAVSAIAASRAEAARDVIKSGKRESAIRQVRLESGLIAEGSRPTVSVVADRH